MFPKFHGQGLISRIIRITRIINIWQHVARMQGIFLNNNNFLFTIQLRADVLKEIWSFERHKSTYICLHK